MAKKASVMYKEGRTVNTGNFESTRYDLAIEVECEVVGIDQTLIDLKEKVRNELEKAIGENKDTPTKTKKTQDVDLLL